VLVLVVVRVLPGDPLAQIGSEGQGQYRLSEAEVVAARASLDFDKLLLQQSLS
jgi:ABC-type dipeptide/oligopeptide/nickel transport system permease component